MKTKLADDVIVSVKVPGQHSRLAVILHADICDSTELLQQHEIVAHTRMKDSFKRLGQFVSSYHGRVCELRGDALVAVFNRASDAVAAAVEFQEKQSILVETFDDGVGPKLRIGIALGEVVIDSHAVSGVGVVLSQRVEQLAMPGGLCITAAINEALPRRMPFALDCLGYQQLKGFQEPIRVYKVTLTAGETVPAPAAHDLSNFFTRGKIISIGIGLLTLLVVSVVAIDIVTLDRQASHWLAPTAESNQPNPVPSTYESIERGARVFQKNCTSCHGVNADGTGVAGFNFNVKPANLRAMAGTHKDGDFAYKIRHGRGDMPAWKDVLADDDIWNLVNFIQSLAKEPVPVENRNELHGHPTEHSHPS